MKWAYPEAKTSGTQSKCIALFTVQEVIDGFDGVDTLTI